MENYKYLEVVNYKTKEVVLRINVTGKSDRAINIIDAGLNRNLNHNEYFTRETESKIEL